MTVFPYQPKLSLWVMKPRVVFQARVNMPSATYPLAEVTYDGVTVGAYTDLEQNQTILFGTEAGKWDLGRSYLRGDGVWNVATSTVLNIGYSSHGRGLGSVDLQDNAYITVVDLHEVWDRKSRYGTLDGSILYDYNIGAPQNYIPVLQVVNGRNEGGVGMIEAVDPDTGVLEVDLDANGSYVMDPAGAETWWDVQTNWDVKDGTITSGAPDDFAITAEFPAGYRYVRFRSATTEPNFGLPRMYLVVALDEDDADNASLLTAHTLSWKEEVEGQSLQVEVKQRLDPDDYLPGTVGMLLLEDQDGPRLMFGGWLDADRSFTRSTDEGDVERSTTFTFIDVAKRLDQLKASPSALSRDADEPYAATLAAAQPFRYAWRYLFFQTSAPQVANISLNLAYGADFPFTQYGVGGGSHYSVNDVLARAIICRLVCQEDGWLKMVLDPMRQELADRTSTVQETLTEDTWSDLQRVKKRETFGVIKGIAQLTSTVDADAVTVPLLDLYGVAPGPIAAQGKGEGNQGVTGLVRSELEHWRRLGQDLARANPREELIKVEIAPGVAPIHPSRLTWVRMNISADVIDWHGTPLVNKRCLPASVQYRYDALSGVLERSLTLELETDGPPGQRDPRPVVTIPRVVRDPSLPPQPNPQRSPLVAGQAQVASPNQDGFMYLAHDYNTATPTWSRYDLAALGMAGFLADFIVDAFSPLYLGTGTAVNGLLVTGTHAYYLSDIAGTPSLSNSYALRYNTGFRFRNAQGSRSQQGFFAIVSHLDDGDVDVDVTDDSGATWTRFTDLGGNWVGGAGDDASGGVYASEHVADRVYVGAFVIGGATQLSRVYRSDDGAGSFAAQDAVTTSSLPNLVHIPFANSGETRIYVGRAGNNAISVGLQRLDSGVATNISPIVGGNYYGTLHNFGFKTYDLGQLRGLLVGFNSNTTQSGVWSTDDGGDSWDVLIAPSGSFTWQGGNIAGDNPDVFFIFGDGAHGYSDDAGANFQDKTGNLTVDFPAAQVFVNLVGVG